MLLIAQNFPHLDSDFVGKEVIPGPDAIIKRFDGYFKPLKTIWFDDVMSNRNDRWFIGIFIRRA